MSRDQRVVRVDSVSHRMPQTWWRNATYSDLRRELNGQRHQLTRVAAVPPGEVRGLRVPFLEVAGNQQFKVVRLINDTSLHLSIYIFDIFYK